MSTLLKVNLWAATVTGLMRNEDSWEIMSNVSTVTFLSFASVAAEGCPLAAYLKRRLEKCECYKGHFHYIY